MNRARFEAARMALFVRSYAGQYFGEIIRTSNDPDKMLGRVSRILLFREKFLGFYFAPKFSKRDADRIIKEVIEENAKIRVYLKIEKQLTQLINDKNNHEEYVTDEYERALLSPAIERVVGDSISGIDNDSQFEQKLEKRKRIYNSWYYSVAFMYKLPTLRIIPFISRLLKIRQL